MSSVNLSVLAEPFHEADIEWRIGQSGETGKGKVWARVLCYINARAIMDRLDRAVGPENWKVEYRVENGSDKIVPGIIARIGIRVGDEWVFKEDGAEQTDIESFKGGLSSALKRAGVAWGIGRYLYALEAGYANVSTDEKDGWEWAKTKSGKEFYWQPPKLPAWALPKDATAKPQPQPKSPAAAGPAPAKAQQERAGADKPRAELVKEVMAVAAKLKVDPQELGAWARDEFQKPAEKLTTEELGKFLEILQSELGRRGEVA